MPVRGLSLFLRLFAVLVLAFVTSAPPGVEAQGILVPRTVLFEEATNWGCAPCAMLNPYVEQFLEPHEDSGQIIQICYHPDWPAPNDPMYLADAYDNLSRVLRYYNINAIPTAVIGGDTAMLPNSIAAMEAAYRARADRGSPFLLSVRSVRADTSIHTWVTIKAVGDVSEYDSLTLQLASVEREVYATGSNGEKVHRNVLRKLVPDVFGTRFRIATGDSLVLDFEYAVPSAADRKKLYDVAFIQNDSTGEVLQAATTFRGFHLRPYAASFAIARLSDSVQSVSLELQNALGAEGEFSTRYVPARGKDWNIALSTSNDTADAMVVSADGTARIEASAVPGSGGYATGYVISSVVTPQGDTLTKSVPVKFIASTTTTILVDVSGDSASTASTIATLDSLHLPYAPLTDVEAASVNAWDPAVYRHIILEANKWIVTGANKALLRDYLDRGGDALVEGGEIAFGLADAASLPEDVDIPFLESTLKADYVQDIAPSMTVYGVKDDSISKFFTSGVYINAAFVDQPNQPDVIRARDGAVPIFYYGSDSTGVAALRWQNGSAKLAYYAFGLQNLAEKDRSAIIRRTLDWFDGTVGEVPPPYYSFTVQQNVPNPSYGSTSIAYQLSKSAPVRIELTDVRGATVAVLVDEVETAGPHELTLDTRSLPAGVYFYTLRSAEYTRMRPMIVE